MRIQRHVFPLLGMALLVSCHGGQSGSPPLATTQSSAQSKGNFEQAAAALPQFHVIYNFNGGTQPICECSTLINVRGVLYGTSFYGGLTTPNFGFGTVFTVTPQGSEKILRRFAGPGNDDGRAAYAPLVELNGILYGTTAAGGKYDEGTVFSISPSTGAYHVLYSFSNTPDGDGPFVGLIAVNDVLYGTTTYGGSKGKGTVFSITPGGSERVLYSFGSQPNDGRNPQAPLLNVNGTLYGTTPLGGGVRCGNPQLCGTVFSISTSGAEHVLHSFGSGNDGESPTSGLLDVGGTLYGTTLSSTTGNRVGTLYIITTGGKEQVLYLFHDSYSAFGLTELNGTIYGTTAAGGRYKLGTIFSSTPSGSVRVVHSFTEGRPVTGLLAHDGSLFGTTSPLTSTGSGFGGDVFVFTP